MNILKNEKSPYLLQHAENPVHWYPWGEAAFEKAALENKPIFLSIGYSTCHWCHVMAHETFENDSVAKILNDNFISIKVDREERPDVDSVYMTACQVFAGSGGWPLSAFIDCKKKPFFVGTYYTMSQFKNILKDINTMWKKDKNQLTIQAEKLIEVIKSEDNTDKYFSVENAVDDAVNYFSKQYDEEYGGFSHAPKFPSTPNLLFLINHYELTGNKKVLEMCMKTLKCMRKGGVFDHVGGGFSRYSTDKKWLVPHFEKMLYDNTLLLMVYAKMYFITKEKFYSDTAHEIAKYLLKDMFSKEGAFYTAEDADSEGEEGLFYVFSMLEIQNILGQDANEFCQYYNVTEKGNFDGKNILNTIKSVIPDEKKSLMRSCLDKLLQYRNGRVRPHRDEKIHVSYNGLAIAAFAIAGKALDNANYFDTARNIVKFIEDKMVDRNGKLLGVYFDSNVGKTSFAEDYSFYIWGLLELYYVTKNKDYLAKAIAMQSYFDNDFFDKVKGGYYLSSKDSEKMIVPTKDIYDGAMPTYNSVALNNLLTLYTLTENVEYLARFAKTIKCFCESFADYPQGYIYSVTALDCLKHNLDKINICYKSVCRPTAKTIDELLTFLE